MPEIPKPQHHISPKLIILVILILFLASAAYGGYWWWEKQQTNIFCGGVAGASCPDGYDCNLGGNYPDVGGSCIKTGDTKTKGTLIGHVTIGPNCPVEREGVLCTPSPEAYTSREFIVLNSNQKEVARFHADASGVYSISILPGIYTVVSEKTGFGSMSKDLSSVVVIKAGQTTTLDFNIDTGIR